MLFNIVLFIAFFCFYCCLIPTTSTAFQDSYDSFIPSVKEAFSEEFDPIPETVEKSTNPTPVSFVSSDQPLCSNQDEPITNPASIVPFNSNDVSNSSVNPESLTYKELKNFIKVHNLQTTIKNICGKPYNRCGKKELIKALKA